MKKYTFGVIFILSLSIILLLPKDIISKNYEIDYEIITDEDKMYVYYVNNDMIVGVLMKTMKNDKFSKIELAFKYLTEKSNSVNYMYHSRLNPNSKLLSYEIRNKDIYLEVNSDFINIKEEDALFALSQLLYTYKELGFEEVYIQYNGKIIDQIKEVILYNGLTELPVNISSNATSHNNKVLKVIYYYKNDTKSFVNYIVNYDCDEVSFILDRVIEFVNSEYDCDIKLLEVNKDSKEINIRLSCNEDYIKIIKNMIMSNLHINEDSIIVESVIY